MTLKYQPGESNNICAERNTQKMSLYTYRNLRSGYHLTTIVSEIGSQIILEVGLSGKSLH
jgi:hypothetical protein